MRDVHLFISGIIQYKYIMIKHIFFIQIKPSYIHFHFLLHTNIVRLGKMLLINQEPNPKHPACTIWVKPFFFTMDNTQGDLFIRKIVERSSSVLKGRINCSMCSCFDVMWAVHQTVTTLRSTLIHYLVEISEIYLLKYPFLSNVTYSYCWWNWYFV